MSRRPQTTAEAAAALNAAAAALMADLAASPPGQRLQRMALWFAATPLRRALWAVIVCSTAVAYVGGSILFGGRG